MSDSKTARVHSFQSLGAVDGPGLRCVVFLQGCPYRCPYCHNPDTRPMDDGAENSVDALCDRLERYKSYFGKEGGVTVSGGEPLMQCAFLADFFAECHRRGITTCLDTAGMFPDDGVRAVLAHTDTVLCDIKHTDASVCRSSFGLSLDVTQQFLSACDEAGCCIRIRHVVVPGLTDGEEHIKALCSIARQYRNLEKIELLPFRKLCADKYKTLGIPFPLADTPECDAALLAHLNAVVSSVELGENPDSD